MTGKRDREQPGAGFWILMAGSVIAVSLLVLWRLSSLSRATSEPTAQGSRLPIYGRVPDFHLTERSGRPVSLMDLKGEVWIADFVFTNCGGPCPIMSSRMREIQDHLKREKLSGVLCVSITVDPTRDTPEVLRDYARLYGADGDRWLFLTGDKKQIFDLTIRGFKLGLTEETEEDAIIHSTRFVLVDHGGGIRGYYDVADDDPRMQALMEQPAKAVQGATTQRLLADVRSLLTEAGR